MTKVTTMTDAVGGGISDGDQVYLSGRFPEKIDFITSPGFVGGREGRRALGLEGGPEAIITDLAVCRFDEHGEMYVDSLHPNATREEVREKTGWEIPFADEVKTTPKPSDEEIRIIREDLDPDGRYTGRNE